MNPYLYEAKDSPVHGLDPRTKIFVLLAWFVIALVPSTLPHALGVLVLTTVYVTVARSWGSVARIRGFLLIITVFTIFIWGVIPREGEALFLFVKRESVVFGALTAIKIVAILVAGIVFLATTRNEEITIGLVKMGVPYVMCFAFSTALRLVPTFAATGATVVEAQRCRGLELGSGSLWSRMRAYIPLMAPIFLVSIRNANLMAMALEARGFGAGKNRTFYIQLKMRPRDWIALIVTAILLTGSIYLAYRL
ncbi:MAG: energy-coupling factor transporter transmembrane protein EcfT [Candidatus Abyssubacteria bacterium]|nr:energy-coupling factor transporter transmembrane protein EcfT [Candidatus Abyssubacteria bacterium]